MAWTEAGNDGVLAGAADVTLVAAPGAGVRRIVRSITIHNDTGGPVTLTVQLKSTGPADRIMFTGSVPDGDTWQSQDHFPLVILDGTDKSIEAYLGGAGTPDFVAAYADSS
ncbi:hypothetical protein LCGC14_1902540 [marine sediment metagenome]|uniref:Uncharacterized protein n=1 Tax=marine sediment metagenome TaxID=412755 RepID=A0A0F9IU72_9ZZZZ